LRFSTEIAVYLGNGTEITAKIMNGDITLEAGRCWQGAAKVIPPFVIFAVFDVSLRRYK